MKKMAKKSENNSIKSSKKPIVQTRPEVVNRTKEDWSRIAQMLSNIETLSIEEFYINLGIPKATFYEAIQNHPVMKEAQQLALEKIGIRREKLCLERNLAMSSVAAASLTSYLDRYEKVLELKSKYSQAHQPVGNIQFKVEMPEIEKTKEVDKQLSKRVKNEHRDNDKTESF